MVVRWLSCHRKSRNTLRRTATDCGGAPTIAADCHGTEDAAALAALFNSRWLTALARLVADPARGGFRRFNARVVRGLPIPPNGAPVWSDLARRGRDWEPADDLIADAFELDLADRRILAAYSL